MNRIFVLFIILTCTNFIYAQNESSKSTYKEDSKVVDNYLLCILDSTNEIQSSTTFALFDNDNYLQIHGEYAVLSYRLRGKNEFSSGKVYKTGTLHLKDSMIFYTIAFQADNQFDANNQGNRYFVAFRMIENSRYEIILCTNTFVPKRKFIAHLADESEKNGLIKKSQNRN
jgi:hypothetical protein